MTASQNNFLSILFGAGFGLLFFGEDFGFASITGGAGVALALFFLNSRVSRTDRQEVVEV